MTKYFLFDCETGGLPKEDPSLLSLFGYLLNDDLDILDQIELYTKPDFGPYKVVSRALEINGINLIKHDKKAITYYEAASELDFFLTNNFQEFNIKTNKIVPSGQNVDFDIWFLQHRLFASRNQYSYSNVPLAKMEDFFSQRKLDIASIARFLKLCGTLPEHVDGSLRSLCKYFGISTSGAHNAKRDVEMSLQVLRKLCSLQTK